MVRVQSHLQGNIKLNPLSKNTEVYCYTPMNRFVTCRIADVFFSLFLWCPSMAINVSVQYNGGLLPDIILLTQCYYHRGTRLNAMKRFCICSL